MKIKTKKEEAPTVMREEEGEEEVEGESTHARMDGRERAVHASR